MPRSRIQTTWVRMLLTVLTAAVMLLIFFFSTESAERSDRTSGRISTQLIRILHPNYDDYSMKEKEAVFSNVQHIVRKTAHFSEYMFLGLILRLCLESWFGKKMFLDFATWASGTLYACTDEIHQMITDGRSGQITDVLLDSFGVLTGVVVLMIIRKNHEQKGEKEVCP